MSHLLEDGAAGRLPVQRFGKADGGKGTGVTGHVHLIITILWYKGYMYGVRGGAPDMHKNKIIRGTGVKIERPS